MSDNTKYIDSIIIPTLQKKCQDLFNERTALEINFQVETAKRQECADALAKAKAELDALSTSSADGNDAMSRALTAANERIRDLDQRNQQLSKDLVSLRTELINAKNEITSLKAQLELAKAQVEEKPVAQKSTRTARNKMQVVAAASTESQDDF